MNMSTRGLNQFVTHEGPRSVRGHAPGASGTWGGESRYFLSPPLPSSPPPLMDS
jgi:hypothetical protein